MILNVTKEIMESRAPNACKDLIQHLVGTKKIVIEKTTFNAEANEIVKERRKAWAQAQQMAKETPKRVCSAP